MLNFIVINLIQQVKTVKITYFILFSMKNTNKETVRNK